MTATDETTPTIADVERLVAWMDAEGLGTGAPLEHRYISGGSQNEIYELRRGDLHAAMRIPPPSAPAERDAGIVREWRIIEALNGTDVPHTEAIAVCTDPAVLGRTFYLMGFVDGWSPMGMERGKWPAPFDTDLEARQGLAYQLVEGIALLSKVDWKAKGLEDLGRPDGFHERQVDRWTAFFERIKGRELPGFDEASAWLRAHKPLDYVPGIMHGDYQFANVMFQDGAPARLAAIVDWEMGTVGDPKLDLAWVVQRWPEDTSGGEGAGQLRRHDGHAVRGPRCSTTTPTCRVARSTTSTTTACWPSGSWPSCSSRATSGRAPTPKLAGVRPGGARPHGRGRRAGRDERLQGMKGPGELFDLTGKVAVVTGGSRGIGRAVAEGLASAGADVVVASRKLDGCQKAATEIAGATGRRTLPVACHVGEWGDCDKLVETVYNEFGRCDVLVNNAGMSPLYDGLPSVTEALYDKVHAVNVVGTLPPERGLRHAHGGG